MLTNNQINEREKPEMLTIEELVPQYSGAQTGCSH